VSRVTDIIIGCMNIARMTFKRRRPIRDNHIPGGAIRSLARIVALAVLSWAATLVIVHFLLELLMGYPLPTGTFLTAGFLWPTLALTAAVTLANYSALSLFMRTGKPYSGKPPTIVKDEDAPHARSRIEAASLQLEQLSRSAERLDTVEQDLIRKLSETFPIDATTRQLLTEMRICTNRLRGQLSDIVRIEPETAYPHTRQTHEKRNQKSPTTVRSDVEFDDVSIA
jgi:hypothetical protein